MKKLITLTLCLVFFSLACLGTSSAGEISADVATIGQTLTNVPTAGARVVEEVPVTDLPAQVCAVVIAETAQNLRALPNASASIIGHLQNGERVVVLDEDNAEWIYIKRGDQIGFARSVFLEYAECVK